MQIEDQIVGDAAVVRLDGSLDTTTASDALAHFDALVADGRTLIVADFGLNPSVREVFDVSGFSTILAIFEDEAAAVAG